LEADLKEVVREKPGLMSQADTTSKAGFLAGVDYLNKRKRQYECTVRRNSKNQGRRVLLFALLKGMRMIVLQPCV
jgi:hypothetical protein